MGIFNLGIDLGVRVLAPFRLKTVATLPVLKGRKEV